MPDARRITATRLVALLAVGLIVAIASACGRAPEPIATSDIEPKVRVVSTGGGTTEVTVVLFRGESLFATYRLQAGESLTATGPDGVSVQLERGVDGSAFLRRNAYVGTLPEVAPREDVRITFQRTGEASAPETFVRVPAEVRVTRPEAGDRRTLNESFSVAWESLTADDVELRYDVRACDGIDAGAFEDLRTERGFASLFPIDGALGLTTTSFDAPADATRCEADLLVGRVGDQIALDPAFGALRSASRAVRVTRPIPLAFTEEPSVATADIAPKVRVVSTADGDTEVTVVLFRTGAFAGTYELGFGERLTATPEGGDTVVLRPGTDRSVVTEPDAYVGTLPPLEVGASIVIALERAGVDAAPRTTVRIPGEVTPTAPAPGATLPFGTSYTVTWEPLDTGQVEFRYDLGACEGVAADVVDDARAARARPIAPLRDGGSGSTSLSFPRPAEATRCEADLLAGRSGDAIDLDPAFGGLSAGSRAVRVTAAVPLVFVPDVP